MINETSLQEAKSWIKDRYPKKTVIKKLERDGLEPLEAEKAYRELYAQYRKEYVKSRRKLWIAIFLITAACTFFLIPISISGHYPFLTGIPLGLILGLILFQCFAVIQGTNEFLESSSGDKASRIPNAFAFVFPLLFCILTVFYFHKEVELEIKRYGIDVPGTVTSGYEKVTSGKRGRKIYTYLLNISFETKSGVYMNVPLEVSSSVFNSVGVGSPVTVRYSKKHPNFIDIKVTERNDDEKLRRLLQEIRQ